MSDTKGIWSKAPSPLWKHMMKVHDLPLTETCENDILVAANQTLSAQIEELISERTAAEQERDKAREALQRIADRDWVITLPDRMDAVRKIAREALQ